MGTPDVGGRQGLGKPLQMDYFELQTTAQVQIDKAALGIVPNTLDVPFTQLGGNPWKYQASPAKPEIPVDVLTAVSYPDASAGSKLEQEQYEKLLKELPLRLSMELAKENRKPLAERDGEYIIFERILRFASRALAWVKETQEIDPAAFDENNQKNRAHPLKILEGWLKQAEDILKELQWIVTKGRPHPLEVSALEENIALIYSIYREAKELSKTDEQKRQKALLNLIKRALALQKMYHQGNMSNAFYLFGALLDALIPVLLSLSQGERAPFWLHLALGQESLDRFFGPGFQTLWGVLNDTADDDKPLHLMSGLIYGELSLLFTTLVNEASGCGIQGKYQSILPPQALKETAQSLAYKLASCLIANSPLLSFLSQTLFRANEKGNLREKELAMGAVLMALHAPILAAAEEKGSKTPDPLLGGMKLAIHEVIAQLKEHLEGGHTTEALHLFATSIREADIALGTNKAAPYFEALKTALRPFKITIEALQKESTQVILFAALFISTCYRLEEQSKFVSVMHQAA